MRALEVVELSLIVGGSLAVIGLAPLFPARLSIGAVTLVAAAILLAQGLVRDLWLWWRRRPAAGALAAAGQRCLCVESGVGVLAIALGLALLSGGIGGTVALGRAGWTGLVFGSLVVGFVLKDWVFEWNPWRLRREKDHANLIFTWRRK